MKDVFPDTIYQIKIYSVNLAGRSSCVLIRTKTPQAEGLPIAPLNFKARALSPESIKTVWQRPSWPFNIIGYVLTIGDISQDFQFDTVVLSPDSTSYFKNDCQPDTIYQITIYSKNSIGNSSEVQTQVKTPEKCMDALGMESGEIPDEAITASSYDSDAVRPEKGRVRTDGAWCPKPLITDRTYEYLEIDMGQRTKVRAIGLQGRFANGMGREYAENFRLEYQDENSSVWHGYTYRSGRYGYEVLRGNNNTYTEKVTDGFPNSLFVGRRVRIIPFSYKTKKVCMRVELYGCRLKDPCFSKTCPDHSTCTNVKMFEDVDWIVARCVCKDGFVWRDNDQTCVDKDECTIRDVCSQICINTLGSYLCECQSGYTLRKHDWGIFRDVCTANDGTSWYYIASKTGVRIRNRESGYEEILVDNASDITALDYDLDESIIFYSDVESIKSVYIPLYKEDGVIETNGFLHSIKSVVIDTGIYTGSPIDIVVDWISKRVYWIDGHIKKIKSATYSGVMIKTLIDDDLDVPRNIIIHPVKGYLYWTDNGPTPYIGRIGLDGSHRDKILTYEDGLKAPVGLAIDYPNSRLYWIDKQRHLIGSSNLDGSDYVIVVMDRTIIQHPISLTVFEDRLSWIEQEDNSIRSVNRRTGRDAETLHVTTDSALTDLKVYQAHMQNTDFQSVYNSRCLEAACEQICLLIPGEQSGITCDCADGFYLHQDSSFCVNQD